MNYLRQSDIDKTIGANASPQQERDFIDQWVKKKLWTIEAKKSVSLNSDSRHQIKDYRSSLLIRQYKENYLLKDIMITENEVVEYYKNNQHSFIAQDEAVFAEIYVCDNKELADDVISTLKESKKTTAPVHLQLIYKGSFIKEINDIIFSKNPRSLAGPVKHSGSYFVVSVIERYKKNSPLRVEHVREDIIQKLRRTKYNDLLQQKEKELKERINVKIYKNTTR